MISQFPRVFSNKAIAVYLVLLTAVMLVFSHRMTWYMYVFGIVGVYCFFHYSSELTQRWNLYSQKVQEKRIWRTSLWIRVIYVVFSYLFYNRIGGEPFDMNAFDAIGYHETAKDLANNVVSLKWLASVSALDDVGYPFYLSLVYRLTGDSILIARLVKAVLSSFTVVLIHRFCYRNFDRSTALLATVFCMLMPNLIWYCGVHNKETEMLFLTVLFIERADYILWTPVAKKKDFLAVILPCFGVLFFRQVLAIVLMLSLFTALVLTNDRIVGKRKKSFVGFFVALLLGVGLFGGSTLFYDAEEYNNVLDEQERNMNWRAEMEGGNSFAKYAGAAVFAPMIFTLPFPTMVGVDGQENQQMIHSGNYVKNILSFFTILALFLLLKTGYWRNHVLSLSFMLGYLAVLVLSSFAQSERFHIPVLPFVLVYAAYGVTHLARGPARLYDKWVLFIFCIGVGWQWFKLKGRGLI